MSSMQIIDQMDNTSQKKSLYQKLKEKLWLEHEYVEVPVKTRKSRKKTVDKTQIRKPKVKVIAKKESAVYICSTYFCAIAAAEVLAALVEPLAGFILHFVILFLLVMQSSINDQKESRALFLALGLVPLIRITSLAIPVAEFSRIYWYLIISIPVLVGTLAVTRTLGFRPGEIGLNVHRWWWQIGIAVLGIGFGAAEYFILKPEALILELSWQDMLVPALILLLATGLVEELAFRGVLQHAVQGAAKWGWIYVALLYAVLQTGHLSALHCLMTLAIALFYGWVVKRTNSISGVSLSHGLLNVGLYLVFPFIF